MSEHVSGEYYQLPTTGGATVELDSLMDGTDNSIGLSMTGNIWGSISLTPEEAFKLGSRLRKYAISNGYRVKRGEE